MLDIHRLPYKKVLHRNPGIPVLEKIADILDMDKEKNFQLE